MFLSLIDLTVPDLCDQVRIVSRIAPAVASEGAPAMCDARRNETCRKHPIAWHSPPISDVLMELP